MSQLKINTESLPWRCDVCHQSDCFDAQTNYCSRCRDISNRLVDEQAQAALARERDPMARATLVGAFIGLIVGLVSTYIDLHQTANPRPGLLSGLPITLFSSIGLGALSGLIINGLLHLGYLVWQNLKQLLKSS